jgi:hypothetical protein
MWIPQDSVAAKDNGIGYYTRGKDISIFHEMKIKLLGEI